jgi:hypothetical protein
VLPNVLDKETEMKRSVSRMSYASSRSNRNKPNQSTSCGALRYVVLGSLTLLSSSQAGSKYMGRRRPSWHREQAHGWQHGTHPPLKDIACCAQRASSLQTDLDYGAVSIGTGDWGIEYYSNTVKILRSGSQSHSRLPDAHGFITERLVLKQAGYNLRNEEVHDEQAPSQPNIIMTIESRMIRWAGHVVRTRGKRRAYTVLFGKHERRSRILRCRFGWENNIKIGLKRARIGLCGVDLFRSEWRSVAVYYENDNGISGSRKGQKCID